MDESQDALFNCVDIDKSFGGTQALKKVRLRIMKGEVHALLGENGAGKSTLMKIIIGLYKEDSGKMFFQGEPYLISNPAEAMQRGISMIHQELNPEPHLTIAESIFLNREDTFGKTIFLNKKATNKRAQELLDRFGLNFSAEQEVNSLSIAQIQMVEIIKAVSMDAKLIIMDEPTSSLDFEETKRLFKSIRELKAQGVSIIYISHRMDEIFEICDRVSVFRDGCYIDTKTVGEISKEALITLMIGKKIEQIFPKTVCPIGDVVFRVENLSGDGFENISFDVRSGEIIGLSGLVGSGRSETVGAIFGLTKISSGNIFLSGQKIEVKNPQDSIRKGICMVNEDRKRFGLCLHRPIRENISLPTIEKFRKLIRIDQKKEKEVAMKVAKDITVKARNLESDVFSLSGGNQQKVVIAKWLLTNPKVLILDEPTRGVDIGAKSDIHRLMCELAAQGMAIIMISSELPEIVGISDRIFVFHEGRINGVVTREMILDGTVTEEDLLKMEFGNERSGIRNG